MSEIDQIATALAKAQMSMNHAAFDSTNPHFKSKFASLPAVIDAVRHTLNEHGIAVVQSPFDAEDGIGIRTILAHESGQSMTSEYVMPVDKQTPQGLGSAITYGRRYALAAVCCIGADEDDDGNRAEEVTKERNDAAEARLRAKVAPLITALECEDYETAHEIWSQFDHDQQRYLYNKTPRSGGVFTHEQKTQLRQMDRRFVETGSPCEDLVDDTATLDEQEALATA